MQNWQSEFLAVLSMGVLSIYLRQRGSPDSKPVGPRTASPARRTELARRRRLGDFCRCVWV
ncbi:DUF6766 family protein [Sphaerisporangium album]|uniref:DUF6766 family protein n=1 Tax=Sphaerisporangium album TaxID=509200 RepID=UPI003CCC5FD5